MNNRATTSSRTSYRSRRRFLWCRRKIRSLGNVAAHSLRRSSFQNRTRSAGLRFCLLEEGTNPLFSAASICRGLVSFAAAFFMEPEKDKKPRQRHRSFTPSLLLSKSGPLWWAPILFYMLPVSVLFTCHFLLWVEGLMFLLLDTERIILYYKTIKGSILAGKSTGFPRWFRWTHHDEGKTHCEACLMLDGCYFTEDRHPPCPYHPFCHCTL